MPDVPSPTARGMWPRFFLTLFLGAALLGPLFFFALGGLVPFHRAMDRALLISALAALAVAWRRLRLRDWWPLHRGAAGQVLLGLFIAFISMQTILGVDAALGGLAWAPLTPSDRVSLVLKVLLAAILVPPLEETIFRGFLQTELSRTLGLRAGWILAALVYALAHFLKAPTTLNRTPVHLWSGVTALGATFLPLVHGNFLEGKGLNLFLIGLILGALFRRTGMLWLNCGLHGGWIAGLLLASGLTRRAPTASIWTGGDLLSSPLTTLVMVLLGFWLWLFFRRPPPEPASGVPAP